MSDLFKPCPFCGETTLTIRNFSKHHTTYGVWRVVCSCDAIGPWSASQAGAVDRWNARREVPEGVGEGISPDEPTANDAPPATE